MATVKGRGKPVGFKMIPEGNQTVHVTDVKGVPRENIKVVTAKMLNADGLGWDKYPQKYDLNSEGGYAAFYYLLLNGYGINLEDGDSFNIDALENTYVEVEVIHKNAQRKVNGELAFKDDGTPEMRTYTNIKSTIGPGTPFGENPDSDSGEWD
jgi:hypothetical protein